MNEIAFIEWFVQNESDCEEARAEILEIFDRLLRRVELSYDDPKVDFLSSYLFNGYEPL